MASSKLTLIGMYNFDNHIFDDLTFPAGVDKDLAIAEILTECGEFEILYPDINFLKFMITTWGKKHYFTFDKWLKALSEEFNPIHNYDRYEEYTDSHTGSGQQRDYEKREDSDNRVRSEAGDSSHSHSEDKTSDSNGVSFTDTSSDNDQTVARDVSAYDSSTYQPKEQETTDGSTSGNGSGASMSHVKDEANASDTDSDSRNAIESGSSTGTADRQSEHSTTDINKHEAHLYGNIGVTTSVAMLTEFTGFYKDFNLYEQIASLFVDEFCIRIY